ncbi:hypothetical protein D3C80_552650 [compost metagenome]
MHVDRVVGHGQVADPHPHSVVFRHDQRIDAGKHPAVPGPEIKIGHLHDTGHVTSRIDVEGAEQEHEVPVHRHERRVLGMHDEKAHHPHGHLHHLVGMRVVHEGAGFHEIELVNEGFADRDMRLRQAADTVHARRQDHAVPVNRRMFGQFVSDEDTHPVTLHSFDGRAGGLAVVTP